MNRHSPVRMCVVLQTEDGWWQPYCIACHWQPRPVASKRAAENRASHHSCPQAKASS